MDKSEKYIKYVTDISIIEGCIKQKRAAQELLFDNFYNYAMTVATRYTVTFQEAEEVVNDAFVKVFTRIATHYSLDQPFKGWLRRIVINTSIDHYRRRDKLVQLDLEHAALVKDEDSVIDSINREQILTLVQHLTPVRRLVFNMYVIEGYKHQEIAELLNITEGASKSALSRAREDLRRMLNENAF